MKRNYKCRQYISVDKTEVVLVQQGVITQSVLHGDGTEVLLGVFGPNDILLNLCDKTYHMRYQAQTDVAIIKQDWQAIANSPAFLEYLRRRLIQTESWAAFQAYPYLEYRIIGILSLLAEQFGTGHSQGTLIDLRITHTQLASAVGSNRTTVTRALSYLRKRNLVISIGSGKNERFCLPAVMSQMR